jgi:sulfate transport system ATP-binding protein
VVERVVRLGFEVRVDLRDVTTGERFCAQVTRGDSEALHLLEGDFVRARATRLPAPVAG